MGQAFSLENPREAGRFREVGTRALAWVNDPWLQERRWRGFFWLAGEGEAAGEGAHFFADGGDGCGIGGMAEGLVQVVADFHHLFLHHAAGGDGGGADADAAAFEDGDGIEGDGVFVRGDAGVVEQLLGVFAGEVVRTQVDEHEVVIGAAADEAVAVVGRAARRGLWH